MKRRIDRFILKYFWRTGNDSPVFCFFFFSRWQKVLTFSQIIETRNLFRPTSSRFWREFFGRCSIFSIVRFRNDWLALASQLMYIKSGFRRQRGESRQLNEIEDNVLSVDQSFEKLSRRDSEVDRKQMWIYSPLFLTIGYPGKNYSFRRSSARIRDFELFRI